MLFLVKIVRTTNDNFASVFYNKVGLLAYFWIGFTICAFSVFCSYLLIQIHESVMTEPEETQKEGTKEHTGGFRAELLNVKRVMGNLPRKFWIFCIIDACGYSSIHAFYPNMPKFFQEKFDFSNTEAGVISSMPYGIASLSVPVFGSLLRGKSDQDYMNCFMGSLLMVFASHSCYLLMFEHLSYQWVSVAPIVMFGLGHALFTTLVSPIVPKLVEGEQELLPICFSILKVLEGFCITIFTQMAGGLRQSTGSYTWVSLLLMGCNGIALAASWDLAQQTASPSGGFGARLMDLLA